MPTIIVENNESTFLDWRREVFKSREAIMQALIVLRTGKNNSYSSWTDVAKVNAQLRLPVANNTIQIVREIMQSKPASDRLSFLKQWRHLIVTSL